MNIGVNARLLFSDHMEGVARYIYQTTYHMAITQPDDVFYLFYDRKPKCSHDFPSNVKKIIIPIHARHPVLWHIWFDILLPQYFKKYQIDIFYSGDGYLSLTTKVPTVLVVHDLAYLHFPEHIKTSALWDYRFFVPKYLQKAAHIITVSQYVKDDIIIKLGIDSDKITVAYNALNDDISSDEKWLTRASHDPYFMYVGSLNQRKNIITMIDAFTEFNNQNDQKFKFVIAGKIAWKSDQLVSKLKTTKNIIYLGPISEDEKYTFLSQSVACLYASLHEGFGIPILEGFKAKVPVITSNVSSMPEVAGDAALLCDPNDKYDIIRAMQKVSKDSNLRTELINKGTKRLKDFSWQKSAQIIYKKMRINLLFVARKS